MVERSPEKAGVGGSTPSLATIIPASFQSYLACRMAAPEVARTAAEMAGRSVVVKIDTERYPEVAARFNVRGIPNFMVFSGGRPVVQQAGVVDHQQMETWLKSAGAASAA